MELLHSNFWINMSVCMGIQVATTVAKPNVISMLRQEEAWGVDESFFDPAVRRGEQTVL